MTRSCKYWHEVCSAGNGLISQSFLTCACRYDVLLGPLPELPSQGAVPHHSQLRRLHHPLPCQLLAPLGRPHHLVLLQSSQSLLVPADAGHRPHHRRVFRCPEAERHADPWPHLLEAVGAEEGTVHVEVRYLLRLLS